MLMQSSTGRKGGNHDTIINKKLKHAFVLFYCLFHLVFIPNSLLLLPSHSSQSLTMSRSRPSRSASAAAVAAIADQSANDDQVINVGNGRKRRAQGVKAEEKAKSGIAKKAKRETSESIVPTVPLVPIDKFNLFSTTALWAWANSYEGFPHDSIAATHDDRDRLLLWLASNSGVKAPAPASITKCWRKANKGTKMVAMTSEEEDKEIKNRDEEDDGVDNVDNDDEEVIIDDINTDKVSSDTPLVVTPQTPGQCPHCPAASTTVFCSVCLMRRDRAYMSQENIDRRQEKQQATRMSQQSVKPGSSGTSSHTSTTPAPSTLSSRDREYQRLTNEGGAYPRFDDAAAMPIQIRFDMLSQAYSSSKFEPPSSELLALVRSGKLKPNLLGLCIPQLIGDGDRADSNEEMVLRFRSDGTPISSSRAPIKVASLTCIDDLTSALIGTIIPALIDRPRALMDWLTLVTSVRQLAKDDAWSVGHAYLMQQLNTKISARVPFGTTDTMILQSVFNARNHRPVSMSVSSSSSSAHRATSLMSTPSNELQTCRRWNANDCTYGDGCRYKHECLNHPKCAGQPTHRVAACNHQSAVGSSTSTPSASRKKSSGNRNNHHSQSKVKNE